MEIPEPITELIQRAKQGDDDARTRLWNVVFPILQERAKVMLHGNNVAEVMRPSDLLQAAFVQLLAREKIGWNDRKHLFGFAVTVMRHIVIDEARRSLRKDRIFTPVDEELGLKINEDVSWVEVDEVLTQLAAIDATKAQVVELRAYGGLTNEEIAAQVDVSVATVKRHMSFARAFILSRMGTAGSNPSSDKANS